MGIIGMKPLGDGYLHRSVKQAFDYALAQEVDVLACGFNSLDMLEADIEAVANWERPTERALDDILRGAPELGDYVCRQCGQCKTEGLDIPKVFELEGKFDRQMFDGHPTDALDLCATAAIVLLVWQPKARTGPLQAAPIAMSSVR